MNLLDINKYASKKIKELRIKNKLSQKELAEELGVSQQQIARFENNQRKITLVFIYKVANCFNVSIDYFLP